MIRKKLHIIGRLLAITFLMLFSAFAFVTTEEDIQIFKREFEKQVLEKIKREQDLKPLRKSAKMVTIPVCYVDPKIISNDKIELAEALKIDSTSSYCVIKNSKGEITGTMYNYKALTYSFEGLNRSNLWELKMIELVLEQYSKTPFIISFSELDTNRVVAFFNKENLNFLDRRMRLVISSNDIIAQQNGTINKYLENMRLKQKQIALLEGIRAPENAKKFLRHDYLSYSAATPNDTTETINLLLEEIKGVSMTTNLQIEIIRAQILKALKRKYLMPYNGNGVTFLGYDIGHQLKAVLTKEQYCTYVEQREINSWLIVQASDRIYKYLFFDKKVPQDQIAIAFKKYVFGN